MDNNRKLVNLMDIEWIFLTLNPRRLHLIHNFEPLVNLLIKSGMYICNVSVGVVDLYLKKINNINEFYRLMQKLRYFMSIFFEDHPFVLSKIRYFNSS